jgi:hypothetical protein
MFGKKDEIKVIYFEGLNGFTQDTFCFLEVNDDAITIISKKPEVKVTLKRDQLKNIDMLTEKQFFMQYLHTEKKPVKVMPKTFYVFKYRSSDDEDKKLIFYSYELKVVKQMQNLINQIGFTEPAEYSL